MKLQSWHIVGLVLALSTLVAAAARPIAANGTTDASVLGSIVSPANWDQDAAVLEYSGSNDGASQRDGSLAAAAASILGSAPAGLPGPRPARAMTRDRIDNNVCIVLTQAERTCKVSPNGRFRLCLLKGEQSSTGWGCSQLAHSCC